MEWFGVSEDGVWMVDVGKSKVKEETLRREKNKIRSFEKLSESKSERSKTTEPIAESAREERSRGAGTPALRAAECAALCARARASVGESPEASAFEYSMRAADIAASCAADFAFWSARC